MYLSLKHADILLFPSTFYRFFFTVDSSILVQNNGFVNYYFLPQHFLYFLPLPQGHGSFGYTFLSFTIVVERFCSL